MKKFSATIAICGLLFAVNMATAGHGNSTLAATYPFGGGPITLTAVGGDVPAAGIDFQSAGGNLIPTGGTDASPFLFFLSNTPNQITYAVLGQPVTISPDSPLTLSAGYDGRCFGDLTASWGHEPNQAFFSICPIPEPQPHA